MADKRTCQLWTSLLLSSQGWAVPADPLGSQLLPRVSLAGAVAARQLPTQMSEGHAGAEALPSLELPD